MTIVVFYAGELQFEIKIVHKPNKYASLFENIFKNIYPANTGIPFYLFRNKFKKTRGGQFTLKY